MSQLSVNHVDYITGASAVAAVYIAAELLPLVRHWRVTNRTSHPHPDDRDQ